MKIADDLLDALGNAYRWACGKNDVLMDGTRIITFEDFLREYFRKREQRELAA